MDERKPQLNSSDKFCAYIR